MSYEEEDTCHMRRRIHVICIDLYILVLDQFLSASNAHSHLPDRPVLETH